MYLYNSNGERIEELNIVREAFLTLSFIKDGKLLIRPDIIFCVPVL